MTAKDTAKLFNQLNGAINSCNEAVCAYYTIIKCQEARIDEDEAVIEFVNTVTSARERVNNIYDVLLGHPTTISLLRVVKQHVMSPIAIPDCDNRDDYGVAQLLTAVMVLKEIKERS